MTGQCTVLFWASCAPFRQKQKELARKKLESEVTFPGSLELNGDASSKQCEKLAKQHHAGAPTVRSDVTLPSFVCHYWSVFAGSADRHAAHANAKWRRRLRGCRKPLRQSDVTEPAASVAGGSGSEFARATTSAATRSATRRRKTKVPVDGAGRHRSVLARSVPATSSTGSSTRASPARRSRNFTQRNSSGWKTLSRAYRGAEGSLHQQESRHSTVHKKCK